MAEAGAFDVVLFGFRNDLARARTLEYLDGLPPLQGGPMQLDRDRAAPQRLFVALDHDRARQLCAALDALGAQVKLVPAGSPLSGEHQPSSPQPVADHTGMLPFTLVLVMVLGAAAAGLWRASELQPALPPPPARTPFAGAPLAVAAPPAALALLPAADTDQPETREEPAAVRVNAEAVRLATAQQFQEAVDRLEIALHLAPDQPVIARNLQTVLLNWGVSELSAGKLGDATDHLTEAARLGDRVDVLTALGVTYLRREDYTRAEDALERVLGLDRSNRDALLALGQIALKLDRRPQALDLLQRAKEAGASGPELDKMLGQLGREIDAEWDFAERESRHFRISFADDEDRNVVRLVLDTLEDAYDAVGAKFGSYPDGKTAAVLYTQQDFHVVTQTPDWAGAAFDGRIKIPVRGLTSNDPNFPRIARHEYAHSLIAQRSKGQCPTWLNEGLAVWAEEDEDGERAGWAHARLASKPLFSLHELSGSFASLPAERAEVAYAESYLAVRALIDEYGAHRIPTLLDALSRAHKLGDAFAAVYPDDLASFEQRLIRQLTGQG